MMYFCRVAATVKPLSALVRYYGVYSNVSRGKRKKEKAEEKPTEVTEVPPPPVSNELKRRWSYFIRKVY